MKRLLFSSLSIISILILLSSCEQNKPIEFEKIDYKKTIHSSLSKDSTDGFCTVDIQFLYPTDYKDKAVLKTIQQEIMMYSFDSTYINYTAQQAVDTFSTNTFSSFTTFINKYVDDSKYNKNPLILHNESWAMNTMVIYNANDILSYELDRSTFTGGAHGMEITQYLCFDLKTGKLITEKDIFQDGYEARLAKLMKEDIIKVNGFESEEQMLQSGYFMAENITPNENFSISEEGLTYIFNPYEIAAYSIGQTEVTISFEKLKPVLKKESPISIFLN